MDKITDRLRDLSLRKSIVFYISVFAALALLLSMLTAGLCNRTVRMIENSYPPSSMEKYYLTNEQGERLGEGAYIGTAPDILSSADAKWIVVLELIPVIAAPFYSALCILAAALLFYRNKLKSPLKELKEASEKISHNDLNFSIKQQSGDELGKLCASFEIMRSALAANFSEMWRQVEERKRLNAAFAHDLRTPLTVLKGYNEMLGASPDIAARDTAAIMEKHISRLECYVDSMGKLRRLEDAAAECRSISLQDFIASLAESANMLCRQKDRKFSLQNNTVSEQICLDKTFVSQVCGNLLSNASRYAVMTVTMIFEEKEDGLLLAVSDDGKGFSESMLKKAADPYITEEKNHAEHFGLGLYICKILCERHGGYLTLENYTDGAKVSAFFSIL